MANENNSMTLITQMSQLNKQFTCFLRSQNRSRFVQNKNFGTTNQCFDDFNFLFETNRKIFNFCTSINFKIVLCSSFFCDSYCFFKIEQTILFRLHAEYNVLSNCK